MKWIKPLSLNENEEDLAKKELIKLGLVDKDPFHDRFDRAMTDWHSDPEISAAFETLRSKADAIIAKHELKDDDPIDFNQPIGSNWEGYLDKMSDEPWENVGIFDYLALVGEV